MNNKKRLTEIPTPCIRAALISMSAVAVLLAFGASCNRSPLSNSYRSAEALAEAVLAVLQQEDREGMLALMVTSEEHLDLLWEQLPESNHLPFEYARDINERNSSKAIAAALDDYGGERYRFVSIEFTEDSEQYEGFTLHFGAVLNVIRMSDGVEGTLPILDVLLEYGGRWKLMNYDE